ARRRGKARHQRPAGAGGADLDETQDAPRQHNPLAVAQLPRTGGAGEEPQRLAAGVPVVESRFGHGLLPKSTSRPAAAGRSGSPSARERTSRPVCGSRCYFTRASFTVGSLVSGSITSPTRCRPSFASTRSDPALPAKAHATTAVVVGSARAIRTSGVAASV